MKDKLRTILDQ